MQFLDILCHLGQSDDEDVGSGETVEVNISSRHPCSQGYADLWIPLNLTTCSAEIRAGHLCPVQRKHSKGNFKTDANKVSGRRV